MLGWLFAFADWLTVKPKGWTEMSVTFYLSPPRKIPEEQISHLKLRRNSSALIGFSEMIQIFIQKK